jgi:putative methionine-R-sulfoxide reductase with GAF domain
MFTTYLQDIGLKHIIKYLEKTKLNNFVKEVFSMNFPSLSKKEIEKLYIYDIPKISADGSCSILEEKNEKPYNLAETFGLSYDLEELVRHPQTIRLWRLQQIVKKLFTETETNWLGIYRKIKNIKRELVLIKESYQGIMSRPEFPLTKNFAKKSNNSTVGLTGKAIILQDIFFHKGPYYKCDGNVQSEFCLPIISKKNILGIIDAESFQKNFYTNARILQIAKVAFDLGERHLGV